MPNQPDQPRTTDTAANGTSGNGTGMATPAALTSTALSSAGVEITLDDLLNDRDAHTSTGNTATPETDADVWDPWDLDTTGWTALDYTIHTTLTGTQPALTPLQLATAAHTGFTHLQYLTTITNPTHLATLTHHWADGVPQTITRLATLNTPTGQDHHHLLQLTGHTTTDETVTQDTVHATTAGEGPVDEDLALDLGEAIAQEIADLDLDYELLTLTAHTTLTSTTRSTTNAADQPSTTHYTLLVPGIAQLTLTPTHHNSWRCDITSTNPALDNAPITIHIAWDTDTTTHHPTELADGETSLTITAPTPGTHPTQATITTPEPGPGGTHGPAL